MVIYHLTTQSEWDDAQKRGYYIAPSLEREGFIHASTREQILSVANAFYQDAIEPILLVIEVDNLDVPLQWEAPVHPNPEQAGALDDVPLFPHIYGNLNLSAVVTVYELPRGDDGHYVYPVEIA